jgi:hypothetical protein
MKLKLLLAAAISAVALFAIPAMASASSGSSCYSSPRGCVSVSGYYKPSTGTYVRPYVRNYPGYGSSYSYRPSRSYSPTYSYRAPRIRSYSYGYGF